MFRAGIAGATGYTGIELVQLIHRHPQMTVGWLTSESNAGQPISAVHPVPWDYPLIRLAEALQRTGDVDVVFLCLPHTASIEPVRAFQATGVRAVDLSADFRLQSAAAYEKWYRVQHKAPDLIPQFVYGLCEVNRATAWGRTDRQPGCYPTSVNLGLHPLARPSWLSHKVIIDARAASAAQAYKPSCSITR